MHIVIIDDDPEELEIITEAIDEVAPGTVKQVFLDPEEAVRLLLAVPPPDVILLDNIMPKLKGVEVIRKIMTLPNLANTKIVVLSNHISPADTAIIKSLGIEVFQKGFNFKAIVNSMRLILLPGSSQAK